MKQLLILPLLLLLGSALPAEISVLSVQGTLSAETCGGKAVLRLTGQAGPFNVWVADADILLENVQGEVILSGLCLGENTILVNPVQFPHCQTVLTAAIPLIAAIRQEEGNATPQMPLAFKQTESSILDADGGFKMFPNPSKGEVTFYFNFPDAAGNIDLTLFNNDGQAVFKQSLAASTESFTCQLGYLPAGTYFALVSPQKGVYIRQMLVLAR